MFWKHVKIARSLKKSRRNFSTGVSGSFNGKLRDECMNNIDASECFEGSVKLMPTAAHVECVAAPNASGCCHGVPCTERARAQELLMGGAKPMSSNGEQVAHDVVDREEPLGVCHRFEAPHVALAATRRLVGSFDPVVGVASRRAQLAI